MGRLNNDEQFKFLISCIRYSNNGKVDFTEVAKECKIVSKGAAAKRYERMMKAHGIHQQANSSRDSVTSTVRRSKDDDGMQAPKKRKLDEANNYVGCGSGRQKVEEIKEEIGLTEEQDAMVKNEVVYGEDKNTSVSGWGSFDKAFNDFDDFVHSGAFEPANAHSNTAAMSATSEGLVGSGQTQASMLASEDQCLGGEASPEDVIVVD